ncbi:hypothetical protein CAPTEDRAFT_141192, partial [Capitella teleta]
RLRCLPYVYLVGVTKSGTTDLVRFLVRHPDLHQAGNKEPNWWNRDRFTSTSTLLCHPGAQNPFNDYLNMFDYPAEQIDNRFIKQGDIHWHPGITIDGSSFLLWKDDYWTSIPGNQGLSEPKFLSAHAIRAVQPDASIVATLRNPTDRLFSQFSMTSFHTKTGLNVSHFHRVVSAAIDAFEKCVSMKAMKACVYEPQPSIADTKQISLVGSIYSVYLEDWLQVFPKNQIFVLRAEDYFRNRTSVLNQVYNFLGLGECYLITDAAFGITLASDLEPTFQRASSTAMFPKTRRILDNFFAPFNQKLVKLLRDHRFLWRKF